MWSRRTTFPQKIDRNAGQYDQKAGERSIGAVKEKDGHDRRGCQDVKDGHQGVTEGAVRSFGEWLFAAQHEHPGNVEHVKDQNGKNHIIQQVTVEVPVLLGMSE